MIPFLTGDSEALQNDAHFRDNSGKRGETKFYWIAREYLPKDWTVICNQYVCSGNNEHQIDFLVVIPGKGILNVDAKGEKYSWRNGTFYLDNIPKDLFHTANDAIHKFDEFVRREVLHWTERGRQWGAFGRCLMFMLNNFAGRDDCNRYLDANTSIRGITQEDRIPGGFPYMTFSDFCQNDTINPDAIKQKFIDELDKHESAQRNFTKEVEEKIISYYKNQRYPITRTLRFAENNAKLEQIFRNFTEKQEEVIQKIISDKQEDQCVHVPGCAGSGKTLLAFFAARRFLERNKRVLYVCYNKNLAQSLQITYANDLLHSDFGHLDICYFYSLPDLLHRHVQYTDNWENNRKNILTEFQHNPIDHRYDVVIMDEAQDMDETCIKTLFYLLPTSGQFKKFIVFSDDQQSIFNSKWTFPERFNKVFFHCEYLKFNLRNASKIFNKDQNIYRNNSICSNDKSGQEYSTSKTLNQEIEHLRNEGISPQNIAILAFSRDSLNEKTIGFNWKHGEDYSRWKSSSNSEWNQDSYLWAGCIQGFKGLETDCLILIGDIPQTILGHTAVTRSKLILITAP